MLIVKTIPTNGNQTGFFRNWRLISRSLSSGTFPIDQKVSLHHRGIFFGDPREYRSLFFSLKGRCLSQWTIGSLVPSASAYLATSVSKTEMMSFHHEGMIYNLASLRGAAPRFSG